MTLTREEIESITRDFFVHKPAHSIPLRQPTIPEEALFDWRNYYMNVSIVWDEEELESIKEDHENWNRTLDILYPRR